ncbi:CHAT domain-containing protein [SCandidatus Aminicenantes bacterium Aminicenantia_JdfR_composite]|nr:CHAT domain-containing protein [SCandidatus Aminicenantes bacterium Aminicenantia_JdfR_composite]
MNIFNRKINFLIITSFITLSLLFASKDYKNITDPPKKEELNKTILEVRNIIKGDKPQYLIYEILVRLYKEKNNLKELFQYFEELRKGNPSNLLPYYGIGLAYKEINDYKKALNSFKKCIELGAKFCEVYREFAYFYQSKEELIENINFLKENLKKNPENPYVYFGLGCCYQNLGEFKKAEKFLLKALSIFRYKSNIEGEGKCLRQLGRVYWFFNNLDLSLKYFKKALQISRRLNDLKEEGLCLNSIAVIYYYFNDCKKSLDYYRKALEIARKIGDKRNEAECLNNIRYCYSITGDYIRALEYSKMALKKAREIKDRLIELNCLISLGEIYRSLGNKSKSLNFYRKGLEIAQKIGNKRREEIIWNNLGFVYLENKEYEKALKCFKRGLQISNQINDLKIKAGLIHNIGYIYWKLNDYSKAIENCNYSLEISKKIGSRYMEGKNLNFLGEILLKTNEYEKSIKCFRKAYQIAEKIKNSELLMESLLGIGEFYENTGEYSRALAYYKKAIREIENVRARLLLSEYKYGFLRKKIEVYERLINTLIKLHNKFPLKGYDRQSFYFYEKAKARALLDSIQEAKIDLNESLPLEMRKQIVQISSKISQIITELEKAGISEEERKSLLRELNIAEEDYEELMRKVKLKNSKYENIINLRIFSSFEVQRVLSNNNLRNTLIIEYKLDRDKIVLWTISRNTFRMYLVPRRKDFEKLVVDYYNLLAKKNSSLRKIRLYNEEICKFILYPAKNELSKYTNLIIIPDGILNIIPFETLLMGKKYLIDTYNISYSPSSAVLIQLISRETKRGNKWKYQLLIAGNPTFPIFKLEDVSNELYRPLFGPFERIPYSEDEINSVSHYFRKKKRIILKEDSFKEEIIKDLDLKKFKIVHFATHALVDETIPWRSAIIFSLDNDPKEDGFLQLREIYNLRLNSDLVVLSGCKTNLGKYIEGEGLVSLARGFLYAGSSSVVGSLWEVSDFSTAYFMNLFYFYLKRGKKKNEALRKAKLEMIRNKIFKHPYHWAGLILIGEFNEQIFIDYSMYWILLILLGGLVILYIIFKILG